MNRKLDVIDATELYAQYALIVLKRMAGGLMSAFESVFTVDSDTRTAFFRERGISHAKRGNYDSAIAMLEPLRQAQGEDAEVALYLGLACLHSEGREADGLELLESAHALAPEDARVTTVLGIAYSKAQRFDKAIPLLEKAAIASPENFNVKYRLGSAYDGIGQPTRALEWFQMALDLRPDEARVHRAIGLIHEQMGDRETAVAYYKRANDLMGGQQAEE